MIKIIPIRPYWYAVGKLWAYLQDTRNFQGFRYLIAKTLIAKKEFTPLNPRGKFIKVINLK
jgi:hypothetical protein